MATFPVVEVGQLTTKQIDALRVIYRHVQESGCVPTNRDLAKLLGVSTSQAVLTLRSLQSKGYLSSDVGRRKRRLRIPTVTISNDRGRL